MVRTVGQPSVWPLLDIPRICTPAHTSTITHLTTSLNNGYPLYLYPSTSQLASTMDIPHICTPAPHNQPQQWISPISVPQHHTTSLNNGHAPYMYPSMTQPASTLDIPPYLYPSTSQPASKMDIPLICTPAPHNQPQQRGLYKHQTNAFFITKSLVAKYAKHAQLVNEICQLCHFNVYLCVSCPGVRWVEGY